MSDCLKEEIGINLYSKFAKEFNAIGEYKFIKYIKDTVNNDSRDFYCFVSIKYEETIISTIIKTIKRCKRNKNIEDLIKSIQNKIKNTDDEKLKKLSIKIYIIENKKENNTIFKKLKNEFCRLNSELILDKNKDSFWEHIDKNIKYIFSALIAVLMIIYINKLSYIGILINFLSINTLTIIFNTTLAYMILFIIFLFIAPSLLSSSLFLIVENFLDKTSCSIHMIKIKDTINFAIRIILGFFIFFIGTEFYSITIKNTTTDIFTNLILKPYLAQTREPSLVKIRLNNLINDVTTKKPLLTNENIINKEILLIGKDTKFIYYLDINDIKTDEIKLKIENEVCSDTNRDINDKTLSYADALISLLYIKKSEKSLNYIANKRYKIAKISDITFSDELPDFEQTFCK